MPNDLRLLPHLKILDLSHNRIKKIENLISCNQLEVLLLSSNKIDKISV